MDFLLFCFLLIFVFLLSQLVTKFLSRLLMQAFHSQGIVVYTLSFLFLPGVVLHELSHLLVANMLFVSTGEVEFLPEVHGNQVKMGSVAIAKTDPFRRFLIGIAPIVGGIGVMLALSYLLFLSSNLLQNILLFYCIFQISNTMFSSNKDMEGALELGVGTFVVALILQLFGFPLWASILSFLQNTSVELFFARLGFFLAIAAGIDVCIVGTMFGLLWVQKRLITYSRRS